MRHDRPRRRHGRQTRTEEVRRMIMQALQAPVPPRLKAWARI